MREAKKNIKKAPICVDCDGTLLNTDLLHEALFRLMRQAFFSIFLIPIWIVKGKANLKMQVASRVSIDAKLLPYNNALLNYLEIEKKKGHELVLATASPLKFAEAIKVHTGIFTSVVATEDNINMSGLNKAIRLVDLFGEKGFIYAGNDSNDFDVWRHASGAVVVNAPKSYIPRVNSLCPVIKYLPAKPIEIVEYFKELRVHQWLKNILIFLPILAAHKVNEIELLNNAILAFFAYCFCASSVYILNDLLDLPSDRSHPRKKNRPFALGSIPISHGVIIIPVLLILAIIASVKVSEVFLIVIAGYYLTTMIYSLSLKNKVVVDVITLSILYTFRIIAGAAATSITPSFWLLAFSMFLFFSLAMVKRYSELLIILSQKKVSASGRGYRVNDLPLLMSLGGSSGFLSVLVMALYINSLDNRGLYLYPIALWAILPILLYWISRVWLKAHRGEMHDDPLVFAIKDKISICVAGIMGIAIAIASGLIDFL